MAQRVLDGVDIKMSFVSGESKWRKERRLKWEEIERRFRTERKEGNGTKSPGWS